MNQFQHIYNQIVQTERYKKNVAYGKPRRGHSEGTVKAHIAELERNLEMLHEPVGLSEDEYWKLKVLINVHDSFKAEAKRDSAILDPQSHASLAKTFLSLYTKDEDLLNIVQYHDVGYAVYRKFKDKGQSSLDVIRLEKAFNLIQDKELFVIFSIIDSCTEEKGREMIRWFVDWAEEKYKLKRANKTLIYRLPETKVATGEW